MVTSYNFQIIQKIIAFVIANCADPDKMKHSAAFYLDLHCLQRVSILQRVNIWTSPLVLKVVQSEYIASQVKW